MSKHSNKEKDEKTNVMRLLDAAGVAYVPHQIPLGDGDPLDGVTAARRMGKAPEEVFKTLVAQGPHGEHFVYVIPVADRLLPRRLLPGRDDQALPDLLRRGGRPRRYHDLLRREDRAADRGPARRPHRLRRRHRRRPDRILTPGGRYPHADPHLRQGRARP